MVWSTALGQSTDTTSRIIERYMQTDLSCFVGMTTILYIYWDLNLIAWTVIEEGNRDDAEESIEELSIKI